MTSIALSSSNLPSALLCPGSKSYANRALVLAALRDESIIENLPECEDTLFLKNGLESLGVVFEKVGESWRVFGGLDRFRRPEKEVELGEGGTTIRFFMALAGLLPFKTKLRVHPEFLLRPMEEYCRLLGTLGVKVKVGKEHIEVQGPLKAKGRIEVNCSDTTQFASALSLVAPGAGFEVAPVNVNVSRKYLEMTEFVKERMEATGEFCVPADFSSLGYFAAYSCLSAPVTVKNVLSFDQNQADSAILDIIKKLGGRWRIDAEGLQVFPAKSYSSIEVDGSKCIDLVPTLMFLFSYTGQKQTVRNIKNLRFKECDRLEAMLQMLCAFKVDHSYEEEKDILVIYGRSPGYSPSEYVAPRDHRMVMTAAMFLKLNGGGTIAPAEAVKKSFPGFFDYFF